MPVPDQTADDRKFTRRISDANGNPSTTVIFYRLQDREVNLAQPAANTNNAGLGDALDAGGILVGKIAPLPANLAAEVNASIREIEGVADIRYFDLDHLSTEDKAYLAAHKVSLPKQEDLKISYAPDNMKHYGENVLASMAEAKPGEPAHILMAGMEKEREKHAASSRYMLLKTLGLNDIYEAHSAGQHTLQNHIYKYPNTQITLQEWDVEAVQNAYGPSKNPSDLPAKLKEEAAAFERVQKEVIPALAVEFNKLVADKKLDDKDISQLQKKALELRNSMEGKEFIKEEYWQDIGMWLDHQKKGNTASIVHRDEPDSEVKLSFKKMDVEKYPNDGFVPFFPKTPDDKAPSR